MSTNLQLLGGGLDAIVQKDPGAMTTTISATQRLARYRLAVSLYLGGFLYLRRMTGECFQRAWARGHYIDIAFLHALFPPTREL